MCYLALDLQRRVTAASTDNHTVACGIGSGSCFVGAVGNSHRKECTIIGDSVNTAARLMGLSQKGVKGARVLCDSHTARHAKWQKELNCQQVGSVSVKGKKVPLTYYCVTFELSLRWNVSRANDEDQMAVVGRSSEIDRILGFVHKTLGRNFKPSENIIVVRGQAGIGKTSLLEEVLKRLHAHRTVSSRGGASKRRTDLVVLGCHMNLPDPEDAENRFMLWKCLLLQLLTECDPRAVLPLRKPDDSIGLEAMPDRVGRAASMLPVSSSQHFKLWDKEKEVDSKVINALQEELELTPQEVAALYELEPSAYGAEESDAIEAKKHAEADRRATDGLQDILYRLLERVAQRQGVVILIDVRINDTPTHLRAAKVSRTYTHTHHTNPTTHVRAHTHTFSLRRLHLTFCCMTFPFVVMRFFWIRTCTLSIVGRLKF